jgi:hypothetical protein
VRTCFRLCGGIGPGTRGRDHCYSQSWRFREAKVVVSANMSDCCKPDTQADEGANRHESDTCVAREPMAQVQGASGTFRTGDRPGRAFRSMTTRACRHIAPGQPPFWSMNSCRRWKSRSRARRSTTTTIRMRWRPPVDQLLGISLRVRTSSVSHISQRYVTATSPSEDRTCFRVFSTIGFLHPGHT